MTITYSDGWYRATYADQTFVSSGVKTLEGALCKAAWEIGDRIDCKGIRKACRAAREGRSG